MGTTVKDLLPTYDLVMDYGLLLISVSDTPELRSSRLVGEVFVKIANEWSRSQQHGNPENRDILGKLLEAAAEATVAMFHDEIEKGIDNDSPPAK